MRTARPLLALLATIVCGAPTLGCAHRRPSVAAESGQSGVDGIPLLTRLDQRHAMDTLRRVLAAQGFVVENAKPSETKMRTQPKSVAGAALTILGESFPTEYLNRPCTVVVLTATYVRPPDRRARQLVAPHEPALWAEVEQLSTAFATAAGRCQ